jgi:phenylpyruvate tautomerase PptA (4-oxalocrotonate tautomerase family)
VGELSTKQKEAAIEKVTQELPKLLDADDFATVIIVKRNQGEVLVKSYSEKR